MKNKFFLGVGIFSLLIPLFSFSVTFAADTSVSNFDQLEANTTTTNSTATTNTTTSTTTGTALVPCGRSGQPQCTLCHFVVGFKGLVDFGMKIVVYLAMTAVFISGIFYILAFTDEGMVKRAKEMLTGTLVGFAFVVTGWLIINVTLWVLSANVSMGQSATSKWYEIKCDTTSNFPATSATTTSATTP